MGFKLAVTDFDTTQPINNNINSKQDDINEISHVNQRVGAAKDHISSCGGPKNR